MPGPGSRTGRSGRKRRTSCGSTPGKNTPPSRKCLPGGSVAVTGLTRTRPGEGLGIESAGEAPALEPILTCRVLLPDGLDPHTALDKLSQLEEEDPTLHLLWNEALGEIHLQLMGEVQLEVLRELIRERFGFAVALAPGASSTRRPSPRRSSASATTSRCATMPRCICCWNRPPGAAAIQLESLCSEDVLDRSWQRLILTHLEEKTHLGVLTGSPLTDVKISLLAGRAHLKHTEGRGFPAGHLPAVRQGLKKAESLLLEPYYRYTNRYTYRSAGR